MSYHAITLLGSHWSFPSHSEWHPSLHSNLSGPMLSTLMVLSLTPSSAALLFTHSAPTAQASIQFLKLAGRLTSSQMIMYCMPNYLPAGFLFSVWFLLLVIVRLVYSEKIALSVIWKHCLETPLIKHIIFLKCIPHALLYNFLSCDPFSAFIVFNYLYCCIWVTAPFYLKVSPAFSSQALAPGKVSYLQECSTASFTGSSFSAPSALAIHRILSLVLCSLYIFNPGDLILSLTQILNCTLCAPNLSPNFTPELPSQLPTSQRCQYVPMSLQT